MICPIQESFIFVYVCFEYSYCLCGTLENCDNNTTTSNDDDIDNDNTVNIGNNW